MFKQLERSEWHIDSSFLYHFTETKDCRTSLLLNLLILIESKQNSRNGTFSCSVFQSSNPWHFTLGIVFLKFPCTFCGIPNLCLQCSFSVSLHLGNHLFPIVNGWWAISQSYNPSLVISIAVVIAYYSSRPNQNPLKVMYEF